MSLARCRHTTDQAVPSYWPGLEFHKKSLQIIDFRLFMMVMWRHSGCGGGKRCFQKMNLAKVYRTDGVGEGLVARSAHRQQRNFGQNWAGTLVMRNGEGTDWEGHSGKKINNLSGLGT